MRRGGRRASPRSREWVDYLWLFVVVSSPSPPPPFCLCAKVPRYYSISCGWSLSFFRPCCGDSPHLLPPFTLSVIKDVTPSSGPSFHGGHHGGESLVLRGRGI
jgi:hypothetical protein